MSWLGRIAVDTRPLHIEAFRRLWLATVVTSIGGQLTVVAVPKQLYDLTGSSAYIGLASLVAFGALAASALWGGAVADVVDRRALLLVTSAGMAVTSALLWLHAALGVDSVVALMVLVAIQGACLGANFPAMGAAIPRLVPSDLLPAASSLGSLVRYGGSVIGPLLAGILIPVIGLQSLYLIDSVALCAIMWAVVRLPAIPPGAAAPRRTNLPHLLDGFRYLAGRTILLAVLAADLSAMVFGMPWALFPEVAQHTFGDRPEGGFILGMIYAAYPAGVLAMGLVSGTVTRATRHGAVVTVAVIGWGLTVIGFGLSRDLRVALAFLAAGGAANFVLSTVRNAITQAYSTDEMRGRTQGTFTVVVAGGPALANVLHGTAGATFGPTWAISAGGVLVVLAMLATVAVAPSFWRYRSGDA